jgi:hypothetical protein
MSAAFALSVSMLSAASADPQGITLKGTYVLSETNYCGQVMGGQFIGTYNFDPKAGLLKESVTLVVQTIKDGKVKLKYQKIIYARVPYTLNDNNLRISDRKIPIKLEFGSIIDGVALYASFLNFNQGKKNLNACQSVGTLVHQ